MNCDNCYRKAEGDVYLMTVQKISEDGTVTRLTPETLCRDCFLTMYDTLKRSRESAMAKADAEVEVEVKTKTRTKAKGGEVTS